MIKALTTPLRILNQEISDPCDGLSDVLLRVRVRHADIAFAVHAEVRSADQCHAGFVEKRGQVDMSTPLNFVTTNDIIGGNSGSPIVNRAGELVGLVFDGNIESLVGRFVYESEKNRTVAVHAGGIVHALRAVYGAAALADELDPR